MKLNVIGRRNLWFAVSGLLLLAGLVALATRGLNLGIDFKGGTILQRTFEHKVTVAQVQQALQAEPLAKLGLRDSQIQAGAGNTIIIRTRDLSPAEERQVDAGLQQTVGRIDLSKNQTDTVGPVIGRELTSNAFWAVVVASVLMLLYITVRFEFKFGVAAIIALLHDVFMILGIFALTGREVDSPFVAAILTIIGYSINDTIVIFDRIRENLRFHKKGESYAQLANDSINQTLARSINTVGTTLVSIVALYFFGGASIKTFTFALLFGITSGAYSSIFIASPIWVTWKEWEERRKAAYKSPGKGVKKRLAEAKAR
ncbi:MAG TPA: protein translocase subunit SecF [Firmicutes bacterium]|nr:protein translocase subunit SecF [Bacillota bacterium]